MPAAANEFGFVADTDDLGFVPDTDDIGFVPDAPPQGMGDRRMAEAQIHEQDLTLRSGEAQAGMGDVKLAETGIREAKDHQLTRLFPAAVAEQSAQVVKGLVDLSQTPITPLGAVKAVQKKISGENPQDVLLKNYMEELREDAGSAYGVEEATRKTTGGKVVSGAASMVPVLAAGPGGQIARMATMSGMMAESLRSEAESMGATPEQQEIARLSGAGIGAVSEKLLGVTALLKSAVKAAIPATTFKAIVKAAATQTVTGSAREGSQESVEKAAENLVASTIAGYDKKRGVFKDVPESFFLGAVLGGPVGGGVQTLASLDARKAAKPGAQPPPLPDPLQRQTDTGEPEMSEVNLGGVSTALVDSVTAEADALLSPESAPLVESTPTAPAPQTEAGAVPAISQPPSETAQTSTPTTPSLEAEPTEVGLVGAGATSARPQPSLKPREQQTEAERLGSDMAGNMLPREDAPKVEPLKPGVQAKVELAEQITGEKAKVSGKQEPIAPLSTAKPEPEPMVGEPVAQPQPEPTPEEQTGIRNAITDKVADAMGLAPRETPERISADEQMAEAEAAIAKDRNAGSNLVSVLKEQPRPLTYKEDAILTYEQAARETEYDAALEVVNATSDPTAKAEAAIRLNNARTALADIIEVNRSVGTENARGLEARKRMTNRSYTLPRMQAEAEVAKGEPLTKEEAAAVDKEHKAIADTQKEIDKKEAVARAEAEKEVFNKLLVEEGKSAATEAKQGKTLLDTLKKGHDEALANIRKRMGRTSAGVDPTVLYDVARIGAYHIANGANKLGTFTKKMVEELGDWVNEHIKDIFSSAKDIHDANKKAFPKVRKPADTGALMKADAAKGVLSHRTAFEVVRAKVQEGVEGFDATMAAATEEIAKVIPGVTVRDVRAAFGEYGKRTYPSKEELAQTLSEFRRLSQLSEAIEDVLSGKLPEKSGGVRNKPTQAIREMEAELDRLYEESGLEPEATEEQLASKNQARINALNNRIEDLNKELETGIKRLKSTPNPPTGEVERLTAIFDSMRKLRDEIAAEGKTTTSPEQKALNEALVARERWEQILSGEATATPAQRKEALTQLEEDVRSETEAMKAEVARQKREAAPKKSEALKQLEQLGKVKQRLDDVLSGKITPEAAEDFNALTTAAADLKAEILAMQELAAQMRRDAKPPTDKGASKQKAEIKALEKQIDEYARKVRESDFATKGKKQGPPSSKQITDLRVIRDSRKSMYESARKAGKPVRTEDEIRLDTAKKAIKKRTEDLRTRLATGDFRKTERKALVEDAEYVKLKAENRKAKTDFEKRLFEEKLKARSLGKKSVDAIIDTLSLARTLKTSYDVSAPLRQGKFFIMSRPIGSLKSIPTMIKALRSDAKADFEMEQILLRDNATNGNYAKAKLDLTDPNSTHPTRMEEDFRSRWAAKIPGVKASGRAYTVFLNKLRADTFDAMLSSWFPDGGATTEDMKSIANLVNIATGRGNFGQFETTLKGANLFLFSPKFLLSRFQLLAGQPLMQATPATRKKIAMEYGRAIAGFAAYYTLLAAMQDDDDPMIGMNPLDKDKFLTVRYGNTRVDPLAGLKQIIVAASQVAKGEKITGKGKQVSLTEGKYGQKDVGDVLTQFGRSKLAPGAGTILNVATREDFLGRPIKALPGSFDEAMEGQGELVQAFMPMSVPMIYETMKEHGLAKGAALSILGLLGDSVNTYDTDAKRARPSRN